MSTMIDTMSCVVDIRPVIDMRGHLGRFGRQCLPDLGHPSDRPDRRDGSKPGR